MSQFYDQASLVMVPSGYKAGKVYSQKPLSTDGELTFTRNSNATRIGPDGKLERVRTNELVYSQDFTQTAWTNNSTATLSSTTTVTPAGTTDAVRVTSTAATQDLRQIRTITSGLPYTNSAYIRRVSGTGTVRIIEVNGSTLGITPTSEWQRFSITSTATSTTGRFYIRLDTSGDSIEVWGCQMEISDFGPTDYIATTSAAVSVGPTANVPRLDYTPTLGQSGGDGCPSLLLEPQRTNLALYSEQLDNAAWTKSGVTVTANQAISPDGYQNADKVTNATVSDFISQIIAGPTATAYAASFYIKNEDSTLTEILVRNSVSSLFGEINWSGSQLVSITGVVNGTLTFEAVGNDWYRIFAYYTSVETIQRVRIFPDKIASGKSVYVWGYQLEQGASYASSYIGPTLGASVTRLADAAYKTGISSLIGQTEGTIYAEIDFDTISEESRFIQLSDGTNNNRFYIGALTTNNINYTAITAGTTIVNISSSAQSSGVLKVAAAYANNDFVLYVNGTQIGTDTTGTIPAMSQVSVGYNNLANNRHIAYGVNQALLFKTRLTNAQLAELTTL